MKRKRKKIDQILYVTNMFTKCFKHCPISFKSLFYRLFTISLGKSWRFWKKFLITYITVLPLLLTQMFSFQTLSSRYVKTNSLYNGPIDWCRLPKSLWKWSLEIHKTDIKFPANFMPALERFHCQYFKANKIIWTRWANGQNKKNLRKKVGSSNRKDLWIPI